MTETDRTTITLVKFYMDFVEDCIGILGSTRSQVISKIIEKFFDNPENIAYIDHFKKKKKEMIESKVKEEAKKSERIDQNLQKLLKFADNIPLDYLIKYLNVDEDILRENLHIWAEKFNFQFNDFKIIKKK